GVHRAVPARRGNPDVARGEPSGGAIRGERRGLRVPPRRHQRLAAQQPQPDPDADAAGLQRALRVEAGGVPTLPADLLEPAGPGAEHLPGLAAGVVPGEVEGPPTVPGGRGPATGPTGDRPDRRPTGAAESAVRGDARV